jgi:hypothetical protein
MSIEGNHAQVSDLVPCADQEHIELTLIVVRDGHWVSDARIANQLGSTPPWSLDPEMFWLSSTSR